MPDGVSDCTVILVTQVNRAQLLDELERQGRVLRQVSVFVPLYKLKCQYLYFCTLSTCAFVSVDSGGEEKKVRPHELLDERQRNGGRLVHHHQLRLKERGKKKSVRVAALSY